MLAGNNHELTLTQEFAIAFGYHFEQPLRYFCALQTFRVHRMMVRLSPESLRLGQRFTERERLWARD